MGLQKGRTNNPNGRPKGSENRINYETREVFKELLEKHIDSGSEDIELLSPKDRVNVLLKLSEFVITKLKALDPDGKFTRDEYLEYLEMKRFQDDIENMTDEELENELK